MRVLFDQNVPRKLRRTTPQHPTRTTAEMGWGQIANGDLLTAAEKDGFEVLVTADKNLRYQQNLTKRKIAIIELSTPDWRIVKEAPHLYTQALHHAKAGTYQCVEYASSPPLSQTSSKP